MNYFSETEPVSRILGSSERVQYWNNQFIRELKQDDDVAEDDAQ